MLDPRGRHGHPLEHRLLCTLDVDLEEVHPANALPLEQSVEGVGFDRDLVLLSTGQHQGASDAPLPAVLVQHELPGLGRYGDLRDLDVPDPVRFECGAQQLRGAGAGFAGDHAAGWSDELGEDHCFGARASPELHDDVARAWGVGAKKQVVGVLSAAAPSWATGVIADDRAAAGSDAPSARRLVPGDDAG